MFKKAPGRSRGLAEIPVEWPYGSRLTKRVRYEDRYNGAGCAIPVLPPRGMVCCRFPRVLPLFYHTSCYDLPVFPRINQGEPAAPPGCQCFTPELPAQQSLTAMWI